MKKVFVMLMILALIVGVFGGCASKAQTASSEEQTQCSIPTGGEA